MAKEKLNKVIKGLKKASKTHAQQAKTLSTIKMKKGGSSSIPDNVKNPSLYSKAKAKAKANLMFTLQPMPTPTWLKNTKEWAAHTQLKAEQSEKTVEAMCH